MIDSVSWSGQDPRSLWTQIPAKGICSEHPPSAGYQQRRALHPHPWAAQCARMFAGCLVACLFHFISLVVRPPPPARPSQLPAGVSHFCVADFRLQPRAACNIESHKRTARRKVANKPLTQARPSPFPARDVGRAANCLEESIIIYGGLLGNRFGCLCRLSSRKP